MEGCYIDHNHHTKEEKKKAIGNNQTMNRALIPPRNLKRNVETRNVVSMQTTGDGVLAPHCPLFRV